MFNVLTFKGNRRHRLGHGGCTVPSLKNNEFHFELFPVQICPALKTSTELKGNQESYFSGHYGDVLRSVDEGVYQFYGCIDEDIDDKRCNRSRYRIGL